MPPPSPRNKNDHAFEAKRRLKREVIHRLASGNKTHSEMAEVHHVLPQRDNFVLCETGKLVNPDDASGAALEDALGEVAKRKCRTGSPDEWELQKEAWGQYDPAFHHISTRAHQSATEKRPKPKSDAHQPYAPCPAPAHVAFRRVRRDLTADSCILAMAYRVLHVHCHEKEFQDTQLRGREMYEKEIKSETVLARAVHLLTLGAYAWGDDDDVRSTSWRHLGGGDIGSVFQHHQESAPPNACDWINMALLREPSDVMNSEWYRGKESTLALLKKIAFEGGGSGFLGGVDPSLRSGAAWLCDFAAKFNPTAAAAAFAGSLASANNAAKGGEGGGAVLTKEEVLEGKKKAAKEKAMAMMKAQMAKFAANIGDDDEDDDHMSEDLEGSRSPSRGSNETPNFSTPVRNRSDSTGTEAIQAMDLSPTGDFTLTSPIASQKSPHTPHTPRTPQSGCSTPRLTSQHSGIRLLNARPQCIICGTDSDPMQLDDSTLGESDGKQPAKTSSSEGETINREKALAFCGYSQASTVATNNNGDAEAAHVQSHVGVHVTLCGHAIHKSCCDLWQRDDRLSERLEGVKRREFRCPLCQRLSNCLIPFIDVGVDWVDSPTSSENAPVLPSVFKSEEEPMSVDVMNCNESVTHLESSNDRLSLQDFLSSSKWWATRNDPSISWDGQCTFSERSDNNRKPSTDLPILSLPSSPRNQVRKMQSKFGKKELIRAWNSVLRTPPRLVKRRAARSFSTDRNSSIGSPVIPTLSEQKESNSVVDVLRRFMDQVSDVGHRADMRRMGEEDLFSDFGEFRHYLSEKAAYNKVNRAAGKEMVDWPMCLSPTSLTETRRQELSREKLISKLLFSIQSFTYTCCSEASEARGLLHNSPASDAPSILSKFGIGKVLLDGDLLLLPQPNPSVDDGFQPFDGRLGKLRYLGLSLMVATSPVSKEVVQLCMSFPVPEPDPFDFEQHEKSSIQRAPVAYPILCSHVLTHTVGSLIAVTGRARAEEGKYSIDSVVDDCRNFVRIGLVARVAQVILANLRSSFIDNPVWEQQVYSIIEENMLQNSDVGDPNENEWRHFGVTILHTLLSPGKTASQPASFRPHPSPNDVDRMSSQILQAIESAKAEAIAFLRDLSLVCQILIPNIFSRSSAALESNDDTGNNSLSLKQLGCAQEDVQRDNLTMIFKRYMTLFHIENIYNMLKSYLLQQIVQTWYADSTGKSTHMLDFPRIFHGTTWPVTSCTNDMTRPNAIPPSCLPLLGNCSLANVNDNGPRSRIFHLPKSYTDLYAELSEMCPDIEQTALCLVCGQVSQSRSLVSCIQ